ncbi:glutathione S-transferase N-terminal domain-containing protein [Pseudomonas sp. MAP12]|uniref:Glutathione S-transferase N-terminal domain-containing protein n=1 Tax=Geopseudomonas aromaticivorans TaxID=2849492 RepID=A0ABS6N3D4_9GAMM|nr:glutathione S-transferase N-terminal domain-containing protein [Pseudomonas aromaticivorans]MBV2135131.1 glutathione S-transferase N-terminal domain-containing protein [Pseudomonas aromaticivorans]
MSVLYIAPGTCAQAAHTLVRELELPVAIERVPLRTPDSPIHRVNPLGRVPALQLDDGTLITENSAILPYLADLKPQSGLFAPAGSAERAQIQSWIGYLAFEVHAGCLRPIFRPDRYSADESTHAGIRAQAIEQLHQALAHVDRHLQGRQWLVAERYTIADLYLGMFVGWLPRLGSERFADLQHLARAQQAFQARPATRQALDFEAAR